MRTICSVDTVRTAEAGAGVPEPVLMQRAATALALACGQVLRARRGALRGSRVVGLVGSGNNGGDALWALSFLAARGVGAAALGDVGRMHPEGARAARAAGVRLLGWQDPRAEQVMAGADLALDGIVGIGGRGSLRGPAAAAVSTLDEAGIPIVAVDVPSGVDSDTGQVAGAAVRAVATVCFGVLKPGLVLSPGRGHAGLVSVVDIGLREADLVPAASALSLADLSLPDPGEDAHKYRRGVVGVTAGSATYPGAALLAVGGARRSGAGMVTFTPGGSADGVMDPVAAAVVARYPDVVLATERPVDARCVGPGLDHHAGAAVHAALAEPGPVVVDASGLSAVPSPQVRAALRRRAEAGEVSVLTPHAGEFARLGFDLADGPLAAARDAAEQLGVVLVLKGPGTVVAEPGGLAFVDTFGSPALATAGSGDVLAGLMAGMLAVSSRAGRAGLQQAALVAARAVGLHGLAGRLAAGAGPVTAVEVAEALPEAIATAAAPGGDAGLLRA